MPPPGHLRAAAAREELHHDAVQPVVLRAQPPGPDHQRILQRAAVGPFLQGRAGRHRRHEDRPELHRFFRYFPRRAHQVRGRGGAAVEPGGQLFFLPGCGHGRHHYRRGVPEADYRRPHQEPPGSEQRQHPCGAMGVLHQYAALSGGGRRVRGDHHDPMEHSGSGGPGAGRGAGAVVRAESQGVLG